jgi:hypothetical protein
MKKGNGVAGRAVQATGIAHTGTLRQKNIPEAWRNWCLGSEVLSLEGCAGVLQRQEAATCSRRALQVMVDSLAMIIQ